MFKLLRTDLEFLILIIDHNTFSNDYRSSRIFLKSRAPLIDGLAIECPRRRVN